MSIILRHRHALAGDIKFTSDNLKAMEKEQGFPVSLNLNEVFSLVAGDNEVASARLTSNHHLGKIQDLYVIRDHRRQGYATQLIAGIETLSLEKGILHIKAITQTNRASKVFEHCGYEPVLKIPLGVTLQSHSDFEGGPQYEITFLKQLTP